MSENYEEDILEKMVLPQIAFPQDTVQQKKILAWHIASLKSEELMLVSPMAFSYEAIIAGITAEQIEYFAKNAPINFKKEMAKSIQAEYRMKAVFEIAKLMDEDMGEGTMQNQKRIRNVYRYILDNWAVFQV